MKFFKIVGKGKKAVKLVEEFLEEIAFKQKLCDIIFESMALGIPCIKTKAYKKLKKEVKKLKKIPN